MKCITETHVVITGRGDDEVMMGLSLKFEVPWSRNESIWHAWHGPPTRGRLPDLRHMDFDAAPSLPGMVEDGASLALQAGNKSLRAWHGRVGGKAV